MALSRRIAMLAMLGSAANVGLIWVIHQSRNRGALSPTLSSKGEVPVEAHVSIKGFQFDPPTVLVKKGGKVIFTNFDSTPHTATPLEGAQFTGTGRLKRNESKAVEFVTTGVQAYFCDIHPSMVGKVIVQ
jgi:plastocyanin